MLSRNPTPLSHHGGAEPPAPANSPCLRCLSLSRYKLVSAVYGGALLGVLGGLTVK